MPYNNALNRSIAEQLRKNDEAYIKHTANSYDVAESQVGYAHTRNVDESNIHQIENDLQYKENHLEGGAYGARGGFATGTFRDTGYGSVEGGSKYMNNEVQYENNENNQFGGGFFSDFGKGFKKGFSAVLKPASAILGLIPSPQAQIASGVLGMASDAVGGGQNINNIKPSVKKEKELLLVRRLEGGEPSKKNIGEIEKVVKKRGRKPKTVGGADVFGIAAKTIGQNTNKKLADVIKSTGNTLGTAAKTIGENTNKKLVDVLKSTGNTLGTAAKTTGQSTFKKVADVVKSGNGKKRGRPNKMKGSGGDGLARPFNMVKEDGTTGNGKPKRIIGGYKLTPVANMHSSSMAGQGKRGRKKKEVKEVEEVKEVNENKGKKRSDIVKEVMKKRGVNMITASSIVKNEGLYKK